MQLDNSCKTHARTAEHPAMRWNVTNCHFCGQVPQHCNNELRTAPPQKQKCNPSEELHPHRTGSCIQSYRRQAVNTYAAPKKAPINQEKCHRQNSHKYKATTEKAAKLTAVAIAMNNREMPSPLQSISLSAYKMIGDHSPLQDTQH